MLTCSAGWYFGVEHLQSHDIDDHDPDGAVQHLTLVLDESYRGNALKGGIFIFNQNCSSVFMPPASGEPQEQPQATGLGLTS